MFTSPNIQMISLPSKCLYKNEREKYLSLALTAWKQAHCFEN